MSLSSKVRNFFNYIQGHVKQYQLNWKSATNRNNMTSVKLKSEPGMMDDILSPPSCVRGMKVLDRSLFQKNIVVPSLIAPAESIGAVVKNLKKFTLRICNIKPVTDCDGGKMVLLDPNLVNENPHFLDIINKFQYKVQDTNVTLTYENFDRSSVLKAVLPQESQYNVSSFSVVGHIVHLNLKADVMDYKQLIAHVILDKQKDVKTVVNKVKAIDGTFRNFSMEVLAGEPDFQVCVKENGSKYEFDFSKVFWNPRLSHEHGEVIKKIKTGDVVFDVFAGVGPFAVPAAKKKCTVYANDLNPDSYKWLCHNARINKVSDIFHAYNLDGRSFISSIVKEKLIDLYNQNFDATIHILMNLPALALEFLDNFKHLLGESDVPLGVSMPIVYCYFFSSKDASEQSLLDKYLNSEMQRCIKEVNIVRNVAPNKEMIRLVFTIPRTFLCHNDDLASKRLKLE